MTRFQVVLRGFDRRQVDEFIERIEGTLGRGPLAGPAVAADDIGEGLFDVVIRGYSRHEVEARLADYRRELAARAAAGGEADPLVAMIRQRRFRTVAVGGYDPEDVDAFLDELAARVRDRLP